ncbi:MAG: SAM-dependent methyltransferase [Planctomycetota bacterium]|jgi:SAM-dependent methyltransferase
MDQQEQTQFFYEIFDSSLPRLGPGDDASTSKALNMLFSTGYQCGAAPDLASLTILDIGCGNGAQTIQLAKQTSGAIVAVDNHLPFLEELERRAEAEGVSKKIAVYPKDMCALGTEKGTFDLIWSEGALYIMGFGKGLAACHDLLRPRGGLLAVSELSWFRSDPPAECQRFFANEYPAMVDIDTNLATIESCEYEALGHFTLPESGPRKD